MASKTNTITVVLEQVTENVAAIAAKNVITLVAVAGPPGSGKSTLAGKMAKRLGPRCCVVPMDGFHLDNAILTGLGRLSAKGAPDTFDHRGFAKLIDDLKAGRAKSFPVFDRNLDRVIKDGGLVSEEVTIFLFEGNYLLFDDPDWSDLARKWDASIWLDVPDEVLGARLTRRWVEQGMVESLAIKRVQSNDLVNAQHVKSKALPATWTSKN